MRLTGRVIPRFPAQVVDGPGVSVEKSNGIWSIGLDTDNLLPVTTVTDPQNTYVAVLMPDGSYGKVPAETISDIVPSVPPTFNVKDYGAVGDGITDDTGAINNAFAAARVVCGLPYGPRNAICVEFPKGAYNVTSVNATMLTGYGSTVVGYGAQIIGTQNGVAVFDALGSELVHFKGIAVETTGGVAAKVGIQFGQFGGGTAGCVCFEDCAAVGIFTLASLLNVGGEESSTFNCFWRNNATTANSWCVVEDGFNHWGVTSLYATVTLVSPTAFGFVQVMHKNDLMMRGVGAGANGEVVWTGPGYAHIWEDCYFYTPEAARHVRIWADGSVAALWPQAFKFIRGQFEGNAAVAQFIFDGNLAANPTITGFVLENNTIMATQQIFEWSGTGTITLLDAEIVQNIGSTVTPANGWFNDPAKFKMVGKMTNRNASGSSTGFSRPFIGDFFATDANRIAYDTGTYDVYSALFKTVANARKITKGDQRWYGASATAYADNTLDAAAFAEISGGAVKVHAGTAIPAGGTAGAGLLVSATANFGVFFGSGAPSLSAAKGSLYLRSDGSGTTDRAYINTNGSTTWTALTTVA